MLQDLEMTTVNKELSGQISLPRSDMTMNALYERYKTSKEDSSEYLTDKLQGYLQQECQLPLPQYQEGGVFTNYIKSDQFKYNAADEAPAQTHKFRYQSNANSDGSEDLK